VCVCVLTYRRYSIVSPGKISHFEINEIAYIQTESDSCKFQETTAWSSEKMPHLSKDYVLRRFQRKTQLGFRKAFRFSKKTCMKSKVLKLNLHYKCLEDFFKNCSEGRSEDLHESEKSYKLSEFSCGYVDRNY
jgi:hypothetical protein